ncbi:MAG: glycogen synthase GlgA [Firmicutes bacterium]|nr:glycogen synthase GlgA [Bacillota bacterium]
MPDKKDKTVKMKALNDVPKKGTDNVEAKKTAEKPIKVTAKKTAAEPLKATAKTTAAKIIKNVKTDNAPAKKSVKSKDYKRKVLVAAGECLPFIATGGLGEVVGSLPKSVAKVSGFDVRVFLPLYSDIAEEFRKRMSFVGSLKVQLGWRSQYCGVFLIEENNVKYYFIDNEYYFKRNGIYGHFDDGERFAFFSKSIFEVMSLLNFFPDVVHCNDWQTALIPIYLKAIYSKWFSYKNIKTIFTIHNIEYQGKYSMDIIEDIFGISKSFAKMIEYDGLINLVKGAVVCADKVSTVSPTYAKEILSSYFSHGLDRVLELNKGKITGILNGIDVESYNPSTDAALFANFDVDNIQNKAVNKHELQKMLALPSEDDVPVLSIISRLVPHKGLDLVRCVIEDLLQQKIQIIILGKGDAVYESYFMDLQKIFSDKVRAVISYNGDLARKIYAGSDIFLMPSKSEPCGLSQMIASRYGTVPIVRQTGGLFDSITEENGFTFNNYNAHEMLEKIKCALKTYEDKDKWRKLIKNVMESDFSWDKSAGEYIKLYGK